MRGPAIAGILILTVLLGACGRATHDKSPRTTSVTSQSRHVVGASGMVVARSDNDVRFCGGPIFTSLTWGPPYCAGIHVGGVNLSTLSYRKTSHGVTWGSAYLAGTFRNDTLHVTDQGHPRPDSTWPRLASNCQYLWIKIF